MSVNKELIAELRAESAATRKMLGRVPMDNPDYRPHPKSMPLLKLANHVAKLPEWITMVLTAEEFDFTKQNSRPPLPSSIDELLQNEQTAVETAIKHIEKATSEEYEKIWSLKNGEHVIFSQPKLSVIRSFAMSHLYHHRGQLSVYLRMLDIPVPGMYGPSADDGGAEQLLTKPQAKQPA